MKAYRRRRWCLLAALTAGTTLQISACREDAVLLMLRTAFTSITMPMNNFIQQFFASLM